VPSGYLAASSMPDQKIEVKATCRYPYGSLITKCDTVSGNGKGAASVRTTLGGRSSPSQCGSRKGHEMKALGIAAATAIALAPFSVVATTSGVAQAAPCAGVFANPTSCQNCLLFVEVYQTSNVCGKAAPSRPAQAPPSRVLVQTPEGIVKLFENTCGAVDVSGLGCGTYWLTVSFMPLQRL
jgi:hypothetical protein